MKANIRRCRYNMAVSLIRGLWSVKSRVWSLKPAGRKDMPVRFLSSRTELKSTLKHKSRRFRLVRIAVRNTVELFPPGKIMIWMVITRCSKSLTSSMQIDMTSLFQHARMSLCGTSRSYDPRTWEIYPSRRNCICRSAGRDTYDLFDVLSKLRCLHEAVRIDLMCRWLRRRVSPFKITGINGRVHALFLQRINLK